eukprot:gene14826-14961_t
MVRHFNFRALILAGVLSATALLNFSQAKDTVAVLAKPQDPVLLTLSGAITAHNSDADVVLDLAMLKALPVISFKTHTTWTPGENTFTGVPLKALLEYVGAKGKMLHAVALNDYAVDIPVSDAVVDGPIVAYEFNGQKMSIRDKGPLWIVYPFDSKGTYQTEQIYTRSIWQLSQIVVKD